VACRWHREGGPRMVLMQRGSSSCERDVWSGRGSPTPGSGPAVCGDPGLPPRWSATSHVSSSSSGGMATVYLHARQPQRRAADSSRSSASIRTIIGDKNFRRCSSTRHRSCRAFVHPNVCSLHDYEAQGDTYYIAMEYLMGESLSRIRSALVKRGKPPSLRESWFMARYRGRRLRGAPRRPRAARRRW
jgi:serine/threonine protein kinase